MYNVLGTCTIHMAYVCSNYRTIIKENKINIVGVANSHFVPLMFGRLLFLDLFRCVELTLIGVSNKLYEVR